MKTSAPIPVEPSAALRAAGAPVGLTRRDRCDRCRATAQVKVEVSGRPLLFCGHHFDEHEDALAVARATVLINDRPLIGGTS